MKRKTLVVLVMLLFGGFLIQAAMAAEIVINIDGGSNLEALKETMFNPFEKATGHKLIYDEGANYAKLRAMVKSGNVEWDIAEAWSQDLVEILSREGVLEPIDYNIVGNGMHGVYRKDLYEEFLHPYGVADGFYTSLIGYNAEKFLEGKGPTGWKDFWDVEKFPGPRALQSGPWNNLEFALVADGVPPEELYPLDVDRAFQVLDRIKPHVKVWWTSGAQPVQLLTDKEVDMTSIWNGRLLWIKKQGVKVEGTWNQALIMASAYVIPKGAKNKTLAMELIQWCLQPEPQARHAEIIGYPGINKRLYDFLDPTFAPNLPSYPANYEVQVKPDYGWWIENREKVQERWDAWILK